MRIWAWDAFSILGIHCVFGNYILFLISFSFIILSRYGKKGGEEERFS